MPLLGGTGSMTFTIGPAEVTMMVGGFALITTLGTVIGNYFVLKSQVTSIKQVLEHIVEVTGHQGERIVALETGCALKHSTPVKVHV